MNQKQDTGSDLQKAIDDITKNSITNPTFADPVAAPSDIPEGAELGPIDPVGPFPAPEPVMPDFSKMPFDFAAPAPEMPLPAEPLMPAPEVVNASSSMSEIKKSALRDLLPSVDKLDISPIQKFRILRDAFENLNDYTVLEPAYKIAREIADENERANALFYIVNAIDQIG